MIMFMAACMAVWAIYVLRILKIPFYQNIERFVGCAAAVLCSFATLFQWGVFIFHLHVFEQIPGWYWPIISKPDFVRNAGVFGLFLLFFIIISYGIKYFPRVYLLNLVLICLAFIGLQYAIGAMQGRGVASLTDRFFLSYHRIYIQEACNSQPDAIDAIAHYEKYSAMFLQTKPPGVLWLSIKLNQIANLPGLSSSLDHLAETISLSKAIPLLTSVACRRSMVLVTLFFPILATAVIWVIYAFCKWLIGAQDIHLLAGYSAILFTLSPNIIMLALFQDQAFYPALFLGMAGGMLLAIRKESFIFSVLMGAALYITFFLSFSMLPLAIIPLIYLTCILWQKKEPALIIPYFTKSLLPIGLGALLVTVLFKVLLNYDILTRYQHMMTTRIEGDFYLRFGVQSAGDPTLWEKILQTWAAARLNNIELAAAIGFPIFILFIMMGLRSLLHVIQRKPDSAAAINTSLFLSYVGLNVTRVVLG